MIFMWFTMIFQKNSAKINKNKKVKLLSKPGQGCSVHGFKVEGCILSGFRVQGWKSDFRESWGT